MSAEQPPPFPPHPLNPGRQCLSSSPLRRPSERTRARSLATVRSRRTSTLAGSPSPSPCGSSAWGTRAARCSWRSSTGSDPCVSSAGLSTFVLSAPLLDLTLVLVAARRGSRKAVCGLGSGRAPTDRVPHDDAGHTDGPHPWAADSPPPSAGQGKGRGIDRGRPGYGRGAQQPLAPCQSQPCGAQNDLRLRSEVLEGCCLISDDPVSAELSSDELSLSLFWSGDAVFR